MVSVLPQPQPRLIQPPMRPMKIIDTTFELEENVARPFATAARKKWTAQERLYAAKAHVPHDLDAFGKSVSLKHLRK
jgi:hypothetical protein